MPKSDSCQKLHYSSPNGFPCLNEPICGRASSKSELNLQRLIVEGNWGAPVFKHQGQTISSAV